MKFVKVLLFSIAIAYGVQKGVATFLEKWLLQSEVHAPALAYDTAVTLQKAQKSNATLLTTGGASVGGNTSPDERAPAATDVQVSETYDPPLRITFLDFELSDENKVNMDQPEFQTKLSEQIQNNPDLIFSELNGLLGENLSTPQMLNLISLTKKVCEINCADSLKTSLEHLAKNAVAGETPNEKLIGQKAADILLSKVRDPAEGTEILNRIGMPVHQP